MRERARHATSSLILTSSWAEYLRNSEGVKISLGFSVLCAANIAACAAVERTLLRDIDSRRARAVAETRRMWTALLGGYVIAVAAAVTAFIVRYGYFTLLQEIGGVFLGFGGAAVTALGAWIFEAARRRATRGSSAVARPWAPPVLVAL